MKVVTCQVKHSDMENTGGDIYGQELFNTDFQEPAGHMCQAADTEHEP